MNNINAQNYDEPHRPQYHFSPPQNWMNDPNGLIHFNGRYHLFYQYNPHGSEWGNMSWGHASSTDLLHWVNHPLAIPSGGGIDDNIFSGSIVYDAENCSGLGQNGIQPLLAFFTFSGEQSQNQRQAIAYSHDEGMTWSMYRGNPIIENPNIKDFRDPKVFWYEAEQHWIMLVAAGQSIHFYRSTNLVQWTFFSDFGLHFGMHGGDWECPDLFPLPVEGADEQKWVMIVSVSPGGPNGGCATQYFVGDFDGKQFIPSQAESKWIDWGPDSFAGATWNQNAKNPKKIYIAWMSNWMYANKTPTSPWRGQMTIPRELRLYRNRDEYALCSRPLTNISELLLEQTASYMLPKEVSSTFIIDCEIEIKSTETLAGFKLFNNDQEAVWILIDKKSDRLVIDRHRTINMSSFPQYAFSYYSPLPNSESSKYSVTVLKDVSSLEVFVNDGHTVMTSLIYSNAPLTKLDFDVLVGDASLINTRYHQLRSVW